MANESDPAKQQNADHFQEEIKGQPEIVYEKSVEAAKVEEKQANEKEGDEKTEVEEKGDETQKGDALQANGLEENNASFREESYPLSDLKEHEKKALLALRSKVEEAIRENKFFNVVKKGEEVKEKEEEKSEGEGEGKDQAKNVEEKEDNGVPMKEEEGTKQADQPVGEGKDHVKKVEEKEGNGVPAKEEESTKQVDQPIEEQQGGADKKDDIELWGVPLLPTKSDKRSDVVLLKFLRAKEFNVNEAFEMLKKTLQWRKQNGIDSILDENIEANVGNIAYMEGKDREGHPVCYNVCGVFANEEMYEKILGSEEKREKFLRWRIQLMEKGIKKLDFNPDDEGGGGGVSSMVQIIDLKNTPLPSRKELRVGMRKMVELLQDNYPEFVAKQIFINVPFWYYAFSTLFAPSLSQRTKSKFVYVRSARVTDTLLKYIAAEELPVHYGGLGRENDPDFPAENGSKEVFVKSGATETIEIPAPEVGKAITWDLTVSGWEVNYKEEFAPADEKSYTVIVRRGRRMAWQEGAIRNSFIIKEPGKVVITIENGAFKKKRVLYRYKTADIPVSSSSSSSAS